MKKRKGVIVTIVGVYILVMISAALFVPVRAFIIGHDGRSGIADMEANSEYGYYPIWAVSSFNQKQISDNRTAPAAGNIRVVMVLHVTSWIVQYVFVTLIFASLLFQARRYYS
jgi:hypothetical protein